MFPGHQYVIPGRAVLVGVVYFCVRCTIQYATGNWYCKVFLEITSVDLVGSLFCGSLDGVFLIPPFYLEHFCLFLSVYKKCFVNWVGYGQ